MRPNPSAATAAIALALLTCSILASRAAWAETTESTIRLYHLETGEQIYQGRRSEVTAPGRSEVTTLYTKLDGSEVLRERVVYDPERLLLISSRSEDLRTGRLEEMTVRDGTVTLNFKEDKDASLDTETLAWSDRTAFGFAITGWAKRHWEALMAGETVDFDYLVPSRLETITFRLAFARKQTLNGQPVTVIRMEPDSWFIRKLVDPLFFYFADEPGRPLVQYEGRFAAKTDDGDDQDLRVVYR